MDEEQKFLAEHGLEPSDLQVREDHESLLAKKMPEMRGPTLLEAEQEKTIDAILSHPSSSRKNSSSKKENALDDPNFAFLQPNHPSSSSKENFLFYEGEAIGHFKKEATKVAHLTAMTRGGKQKVHHETTDDILDANPNAALNALDEGLAGIMQASVADDALGDLNEGKRTIENGDDDEEKLAAVEAVGAGQTMDRGAAGAHERTGEVHELPDEEAELEKLVTQMSEEEKLDEKERAHQRGGPQEKPQKSHSFRHAAPKKAPVLNVGELLRAGEDLKHMFAEYDAPLSAMHHFFEDDPGAVDALVSASRVVNFAHIHMHHQESASEEEPSVERLDELVSALKEQRKKLHRAIIAKIDQSVKQKCDNFFMKLAELGQTGRSRSKVSKVAEILHSARVIAMREMRRKGEIQGKLVNYVRERQVEAADAEDKLREFIQALGRDSVGFTKFTKGIPEKVLAELQDAEDAKIQRARVLRYANNREAKHLSVVWQNLMGVKCVKDGYSDKELTSEDLEMLKIENRGKRKQLADLRQSAKVVEDEMKEACNVLVHMRQKAQVSRVECAEVEAVSERLKSEYHTMHGMILPAYKMTEKAREDLEKQKLQALNAQDSANANYVVDYRKRAHHLRELKQKVPKLEERLVEIQAEKERILSYDPQIRQYLDYAGDFLAMRRPFI